MDSMTGRRKRGAPVSQAKAKLMMSEGTIKGHPMTPGQKGLFGLIAGGGTPTRSGSRMKRRGRGKY
jgi:hypothetical protein